MFCNNCGAQLVDGAAFCSRCGNDVSAAVSTASTVAVSAAQTAVAPAVATATEAPTAVAPVAVPKKKKKTWLIIIVAVVAVALAVVGAIFIPRLINNAKAKALEEALVGETFTYYEHLTFSSSEYRYKFKADGECELYAYYGALGYDSTYDKDYEIEYISEDEILLHIGYRIGEEFTATETFKVRLNYDGDEVASFANVDDDDEVYK